MPKIYKTKTNQIIAEQWNGKNIEEIINFAGNAARFDYSEEKPSLLISTSIGEMRAFIDDYIIRDSEGNFNICSSNEIEEKYEEDNQNLELGSLYEMNKQASATEPTLKREEIREKLNEIAKFIKKNNQKYYMLLNKETSNYTLFNFTKIPFNLELFKKDFKVCLQNRGSIVSIDLTEDKQAYEIWIRDEEDLVYYFFPYDLGVIEI